MNEQVLLRILRDFSMRIDRLEAENVDAKKKLRKLRQNNRKLKLDKSLK